VTSKRMLTAAVAVLSLAATMTTVARQAPATDRLTADVLKGLEFRSIGPAISTGRVQDIAIDPKSPSTLTGGARSRASRATSRSATTCGL
jgi:hypothetical protein